MTHVPATSAHQAEDYGPFDASHPPPLDFETWAAISASQVRRDPEEQREILQTRELDIELWDACNLFWLEELAAQVARRNTKLAARYGMLCAKDLQTRAPDDTPAAAPAAQQDPDVTAFMTALNDDTAVPFASPLPTPALPFERTATDIDASVPVEDCSEPHPDVGETQEVSSLPTTDLPFGKDG